MILTLDHNCIIALEKDEQPRARILRLIARLCRHQGHTLAVYSYLFLENRPKDSERHLLANFPKRLDDLGIGPIETLNPPVDAELVEWVNSVLFPTMPYSWYDYLARECAKDGISLEQIEEANRERYPFRFPWTPAESRVPSPETLDADTKQKLRAFWEKRHKKWNNMRSDVLTLCAHIKWARGGIFVTTDEDDFVHDRDELQAVIPSLLIMMPEEARKALRRE